MILYKMYITEKQAIELLLNGNCVILPTETVYGIFALSENKKAIRQLSIIKNRLNKFNCLYTTLNHIESINIPNKYLQYLPGPLTIIKNKIGYRISSNKIITNIVEKIGPLIGTSANISGQIPITTSKYITIKAPIVKGKCFLGIETTVIDLDNDKILRSGYLNLNQSIEKNPKYILPNDIKFYLNNQNKDFYTVGNIDECDLKLNDNFDNFWNQVHKSMEKNLNINFLINVDKKNYLNNLILSYINRLI